MCILLLSREVNNGVTMNEEELRKENGILRGIIKDLRQDCYKCTCGLVTNCNCKHLGIRPQNLTDRLKSGRLNSLLNQLDF